MNWTGYGAGDGYSFSPQGAIGSGIGSAAPAFGTVLGTAFGQPQLGVILGNLAGQLGSLLPFAAGPQMAQQPPYNPGPIGVGSPFGQLASLLHQRRLGDVIADYYGQVGSPGIGSMLPFAAGPQLSPRGGVGSWLQQLAAGIGGAVGGAFGQPQLGGMLGNLAGQLGSILPFAAAPQIGVYG